MAQRTVELFIALTCLISGATHILWPRAWISLMLRVHRMGRAGAYVNGIFSAIPGLVILVWHQTWSWPSGVITIFGCLLIAKAAVCGFLPKTALLSIERGTRSPRNFILAGMTLMAVGAWASYCLWRQANL